MAGIIMRMIATSTIDTMITTIGLRAEIGEAIGVVTTMIATGAGTTMIAKEVDTTGGTRVTGPVRCTMTVGVATGKTVVTGMIVAIGEVTVGTAPSTEVVTEAVTGSQTCLLINNPRSFIKIFVTSFLKVTYNHILRNAHTKGF